MPFRKGTNRLLKISLIVNLAFLIGSLAMGYYKRDTIVSHISALFRSDRTETIKDDASEHTLATFNREPYKFSDGKIANGYKTTINMLFLGNSLTITGVPEEESDKDHERGLTSTRIENDYVHLLLQMISEQKKVNINYTVMNIADFERNFSRYPFDKSQLANVLVKKPDYVIFQIGENVSGKDLTDNGFLFERRYSDMIKEFGSAIKIVCLPFWPDKDKIAYITNVALANGTYLVDLSHLGSGMDPKNFASSFRKYSQPGVGIHPGDYGMKNIADNIFTVFNATLK